MCVESVNYVNIMETTFAAEQESREEGEREREVSHQGKEEKHTVLNKAPGLVKHYCASTSTFVIV